MTRHLIEVRYIPASARKPARISLTSHWNGERVIIPAGKFPIGAITFAVAQNWLNAKDFTYEHGGKMKRGYFIIVNEFKSLKGAS